MKASQDSSSGSSAVATTISEKRLPIRSARVRALRFSAARPVMMTPPEKMASRSIPDCPIQPSTRRRAAHSSIVWPSSANGVSTGSQAKIVTGSVRAMRPVASLRCQRARATSMQLVVEPKSRPARRT
ncbi:hypothetical protein ABRA89_18175 [Fulvimarina sp. MAC8]